jgi:multiple sugar transport system permease protein
MLVCLPVGVLAAYASTRLKFKGSNAVILTSMVTHLIPPIVLVIPLYVIMRKFDLLDKQIG